MSSAFTHVQTVGFFAGFPTKSNAAALWAEHFDTPYASFQQPGPNLSIATGAIGTNEFELHLHHGRVDVIAKPLAQGSGPPASTTSLDDLYDQALTKLLAILATETVTRVALIAHGTSPAKDAEDAALKLGEAVPGLPFTSGMTDQLIQTNLARPSQVQSGLMINRLVRWSVAVGMEMTLQMNGLVPLQVDGSRQWSMDTLFDINTSPEVRPESANIRAIFEEMKAEVIALSNEGIRRLA